MRNIYNSHADEVTNVASTIAIAGAAFAGGSLYSIEGGNYQVARKILQNRADKVFKGEVTRLAKKNDKWILDGPNFKDYREYDYVVVACPFEWNGISIVDFDVEKLKTKSYIRTWVTLVSADGIDIKGESYTGMFLNSKSFGPVTSIGNVGKLSNGKHLFKLQSLAELDEKEIKKNFVGFNEIHGTKFHHAYPKLSVESAETGGDFKMDDGLFYVNAFESWISTIETEAIAGRNVANLINLENGHNLSIDKVFSKDEL